jgi:hypothetical protein
MLGGQKIGETACGFVTHLAENLWAKERTDLLGRERHTKSERDRLSWSGSVRVMELEVVDAGDEGSEGVVLAPHAAISVFSVSEVQPVFAVPLRTTGAESLERPSSCLAPECPPRMATPIFSLVARVASRLSRTHCPMGPGSSRARGGARRVMLEGSETRCGRNSSGAAGVEISRHAGEKDSLKSVQASGKKMQRRKIKAEVNEDGVEGSGERERNKSLGRIGSRVFAEYRRVIDGAQETMVAAGHGRGGFNVSRQSATERLECRQDRGRGDDRGACGRRTQSAFKVIEGRGDSWMLRTESSQGEERGRLRRVGEGLREQAPTFSRA